MILHKQSSVQLAAQVLIIIISLFGIWWLASAVLETVKQRCSDSRTLQPVPADDRAEFSRLFPPLPPKDTTRLLR